MARKEVRYGPARRLNEVRALLDSPRMYALKEIAAHFGVSERTAMRYLHALEAQGVLIAEERRGSKKIYNLLPSARQKPISLTAKQMVTLFLSKRTFDYLSGTGLKETLDLIFDKIENILRRKDFLSVENLERKFYDINEAPHLYEGRTETVDHILSALLEENRLSVTHGSVDGGQTSFQLDPYTLLVYKKGLYLLGYSYHHHGIRTFSLDGFQEVRWLKWNRFDYPKDYQPSNYFEGAFGLFRGKSTMVRIFFDNKVARYILRRTWHPSQSIEHLENGIIFSVKVHGTVELLSWVLSFGEHARVLEPSSLKEEVMAELKRALAGYRHP